MNPGVYLLILGMIAFGLSSVKPAVAATNTPTKTATTQAATVAMEQTLTKSDSRQSVDGPKEWFTGKVKVEMLFDPKQPDAPFSGAYVTFEPGARSHWHIHPMGQHLIVTAGVGLTGTMDGKVQEFKTGDVLWCPKGVKHWHGASPTQSMTHLALTGTMPDGSNAEWLEAVTDQQYFKK